MVLRGVVCLLFAWSAAVAFAAPEESEIRVRLKKRQDYVELTGVGLRITGSFDERPGLHRLTIRRGVEGVWLVKWDREAKIHRLNGERLLVRGQMLRLGLDPAPEKLAIVLSERGMDVIAHLNLDTYLLGVLPAEMPSHWPVDALKAQAVSARSFVLRQAFERKHRSFDVENTILDQVFKYERRPPPHLDRVKQAISETRGEVLVDARNAVIKAFYSADCGCQSEDPEFVWGKLDAYESVKDPSCDERATTQWSAEFSARDVQAKVVAHLGLPSTAVMQTLVAGRRTPSGRVRELIAQVEEGGSMLIRILSSQDFRRILGFQKIKSTDFSLRWKAEQLEVRGQGAGHGVGLCQQGARNLAAGGASYREILKIFYPRARVLPAI